MARADARQSCRAAGPGLAMLSAIHVSHLNNGPIPM